MGTFLRPLDWDLELFRRRRNEKLAEGAGFEPAAHGVGAGFQDRWIKPLSHPSMLG